MIIRNVTRLDLDKALADVSTLYDGNVIFRQCDRIGNSRGGGETFSVRLTVRDSRKPGAKRNPVNGRRISTACWHVVGNFFDALPEYARIVTLGKVRGAWDAWQDRNEGSMAYPFMSSEACECDNGSRQFAGRHFLAEVK